MLTSVNWEDPALKRWLGTIARDSTKYIYRTAFKAYAQFTGYDVDRAKKSKIMLNQIRDIVIFRSKPRALV